MSCAVPQMACELMSRERIIVDKPLLTVDRQMGLVIVTPEGKVSLIDFAADKLTGRNQRRSSSGYHTTRRGIRVLFTVSCTLPPSYS